VKLKDFNAWLKEFYKEAEFYRLNVNILDPDYFYDYYDSGIDPKQAVYEEITDYYYDEDLE